MEKVGRELASSVGCDGLRHSQVDYPSRDQGLQDCLCSCVGTANCELIVRMLAADHALEATSPKARLGFRSMSVDLSLLTRKTFTAPCSDVLLHTVKPYQTLRNHIRVRPRSGIRENHWSPTRQNSPGQNNPVKTAQKIILKTYLTQWNSSSQCWILWPTRQSLRILIAVFIWGFFYICLLK